MNEPTIDEQVAILTERRENALMIAKNKTGEDRANWLQDAAEYAIVIKSLERLKRLDAQQDTVAVPIQTLHVSLQVLTFLKAVLIGQGYQKDSSSIHQLEIAYSMLRAAQEAK